MRELIDNLKIAVSAAKKNRLTLDHFLFAENSTRVWSLLRNWLDTYFPAKRA